jgi:hypothetical protein
MAASFQVGLIVSGGMNLSPCSHQNGFLEKWGELLCEYLGLTMPILAVPCVLTNSGLDSHPAFAHSIAQLREYEVPIIYDPDTYPPKHEVPWEIILETLHQLLNAKPHPCQEECS